MEKAMSGYPLRMNWIETELYMDIEHCVNDDEIRRAIGWYLTYGFSIGANKNDLIDNIEFDGRILRMAKSLNVDEMLNGKKPPTLRKGNEVEVIVNAKNLTFHKGVTYDRIWHYKEKKRFYYICENDKRVIKRYCDIDLRLMKKANDKEDIVLYERRLSNVLSIL